MAIPTLADIDQGGKPDNPQINLGNGARDLGGQVSRRDNLRWSLDGLSVPRDE